MNRFINTGGNVSNGTIGKVVDPAQYLLGAWLVIPGEVTAEGTHQLVDGFIRN
ncbi:MAG: hypothetical protein R2824_16100 [Saprospiraceae bacterium]|nr:hypothetical protein [Lewinella sp.]